MTGPFAATAAALTLAIAAAPTADAQATGTLFVSVEVVAVHSMESAVSAGIAVLGTSGPGQVLPEPADEPHRVPESIAAAIGSIDAGTPDPRVRQVTLTY
ncbi:MAG: hypothetical protein H0U85_05355, partial [Gemmatimonadales bacterium]|nr:hypothetical protein [Gemmatimonadales bacterium]